MAFTHAHSTLLARRHVLDDGRLVTVRRAVPSDAPELTFVRADEGFEGGLVALNDHGAIIGHAGVESGITVVDGWSESGLAALLADRDATGYWRDRTSRADLNAARRCHPREG